MATLMNADNTTVTVPFETHNSYTQGAGGLGVDQSWRNWDNITTVPESEISTVLQGRLLDSINMDAFGIQDTYASAGQPTMEYQNADGTTTVIDFEDMDKEIINLLKKNEELEARLFKLEEHMRFLREI